VNAVPDADTVQLFVKGKSSFAEAGFGSSTDYQQVPSGAYSVNASVQKDGKRIADLPVLRYTLEQDKRYTGFAIGCISTYPKARLFVFADGPRADLIPPDRSEVRVINADPRSLKVDVTVNNIVAFSDISYGTRCGAILLPSQSYVCKAVQNNHWDQPVAGPSPFNLKGGRSYQLVILSPAAGSHSGMIMLTDK